jgi:ABC-2 type transport system permease protein
VKTWIGGVGGFLIRELADLVRQRTLLLLTVLGPFLILFAFGAGYRDERLVLRTVFVGPDDRAYRELVDEYAGRFDEFIDARGYTTDLFAARRALEAGDIDAVVVFPLDPMAEILDGRRAEVTVIHDQLNPIQQVGVDFAVRIATDEVNQAVVEQVLALAQEEVAPYRETVELVNERREGLRRAGGDQGEALDDLARAVDRLRDQTATVERFGALYADPDEREQLTELRRTLDDAAEDLERLQALRGEATDADLRRLDQQLGQLDEQLDLIGAVEPAVLARPFYSRTETVSAVTIDQVDFFGAAAVALLLQHLALSLGALTFVRDRAMGLFELVRVGPLGAAEVLAGKLISFLGLGVVVAALLVATLHLLLAVPLLGALWWLAAVLGLLLLASVGIGFTLSLLSRSDTQAVQYAMLVLLASLFFSGFFLDHERFEWVVSGAARLLPVTSGISGLQDVMLRGRAPDPLDLGVLAVLSVAGLVASWALLRRELRTA